MKKNILLIVLVLLAAAQSFAQHFDWVRGYAPGDNVAIVGSVTDSVGNLYILGSINFNTCWENGSRLLPIVPHDYAQDNGDAMIAKISPEGNLVWRKVTHGNYISSTPHDIKPLGDTAFACLITMPLATRTDYLYYLDSLVNSTWRNGMNWDSTPFPDYPMSALDSYDYAVLALIVFDFDGNVLEQHFLQMSFLDYNGDDIRYTHPAITNPLIRNEQFQHPSFAVDGDGNIYLSHTTIYQVPAGPMHPEEFYTVEDGTISAVKFWCDRRVVGVVPTDSNLSKSPQILKFAPHFDTLLNSRYVHQNKYLASFDSHHLWCDNSNRVYYLYNPDNVFQNTTIVIDSTRNMSLSFSDAVRQSGFLVIFNHNLVPENLLYMEDSVIQPDIHYTCVALHDLAFDYDSNLVFLSASTGRSLGYDTSSFYSILTFMGHPLHNVKNSAFFVSFRIFDDSISFHSYGTTPSIVSSDGMTNVYDPHGNLACANNRVFLQSWINGGLRLPDRNLEWGLYQGNLGLTWFDYQGNVLGGTDYGTILQGSRNTVGPISLRDSTLYLINRLISGATFGDIQVPSRGTYFACIAKYTDPAFMQPYRPVDTTMVVEVVQEEMTVVRYPNPTTGRLTIDMNGRPLREAWVAAIDGVAEPLPVTHLGDSRYAADLTGRPDGTYILVLVADDHRTYRSTVILQH